MGNLAQWSVVHVVVTAAMAGVLWVVQLAIYPLFDALGAERFPSYHRRYTAAIMAVVGPLMALEVASAVWLLVQGVRGPLFLGSLAALVTIWLMTFAVQVPLHRRLAQGYDAETHRQLVLTNWFRTVAWTVRAAMVATWLFRLSGV
jgi:hypothetical protein